jgi:hypothetical protein
MRRFRSLIIGALAAAGALAVPSTSQAVDHVHCDFSGATSNLTDIPSWVRDASDGVLLDPETGSYSFGTSPFSGLVNLTTCQHDDDDVGGTNDTGLYRATLSANGTYDFTMCDNGSMDMTLTETLGPEIVGARSDSEISGVEMDFHADVKGGHGTWFTANSAGTFDLYPHSPSGTVPCVTGDALDFEVVGEFDVVL